MQTMAVDTQGGNWLQLGIKGIFINILEAGSLNETMTASADGKITQNGSYDQSVNVFNVKFTTRGSLKHKPA